MSTAACSRRTTVWPITGRISKSVASLIKRGLTDEREVTDPALSWRTEGKQLIAAMISNQGRAAIGIVEVPEEPRAQPCASRAEQIEQRASPEQPAAVAPAATPRQSSKEALVLGWSAEQKVRLSPSSSQPPGDCPYHAGGADRPAQEGARNREDHGGDVTCYSIAQAVA